MPSRLRILSVDDDPLLIKSLRDALEADGHAVVTANGGYEAGNRRLPGGRETEMNISAVVTSPIWERHVCGWPQSGERHQE